MAEAAGFNHEWTTNYIALALIALGVGTLLRASAWRGIGSGFLLPSIFGTGHLPPSLLAVRIGGLGAMAGLALVADALVDEKDSRVSEQSGTVPVSPIGSVELFVLGLSA